MELNNLVAQMIIRAYSNYTQINQKIRCKNNEL